MNNKNRLQVKYLHLEALIPYARNARTHSTEQVEQLAASIQEFGWTNPVLVDESGEIIAGHGRVMAAEQLAIDEVPCITLAGLSDVQKRAYRLADNRLPLNAGWDEFLLKNELVDLQAENFDLLLAGFDDRELDDLLGEHQPIDFEKDEDNAGVDINYLTFSRKKIPLSETEASGLMNALNDYVEENGSFFGFVNHLLGNSHAEA
ncbi:ParB/Srx family N-terminal domain-containing protein [Pantoea osteomyelitidis]|uniref:ParB/Srx family N-terminal domain-containing protein n=1 Tax=Pantoea osteomyelitidis TaxID=3230026 RepID=A0ABW7PV78_9GAMM